MHCQDRQPKGWNWLETKGPVLGHLPNQGQLGVVTWGVRWGDFQSFTVCVLLPPLFLGVKLAHGARGALRAEAARHGGISRARTPNTQGKVLPKRKGNPPAAGEQTTCPREPEPGERSLFTPPNNCTTQHSPRNTDLTALLVFIKHAFVTQFSSLWLEVVVHLECLWILINGVRLIQRLSTHLRFSPKHVPRTVVFWEVTSAESPAKIPQDHLQNQNTFFHCFVLFTRKIGLIFLLYCYEWFCSVIPLRGKRFYLLNKRLFLLTGKGSLPQ